jgi:hypothetical protein
MTVEEKAALAAQIGSETAAKIAVAKMELDASAKAIAESATEKGKENLITKDLFETYKSQAEAIVNIVKEASIKQGVEIDVLKNIITGDKNSKSEDVAEFMHKNKDRIKAASKNKETFEFMVFKDDAGKFQAKEVQKLDNGGYQFKTVGPHATADGIAGAGNVGAGNVSSIFQTISAAGILRAVPNAGFEANYRNNQWLFPFLGMEQVGMENRTAFWFEEEAVTGGSGTVAEGASKPYVQYGARLKNADYRKRAVVLEFTDEFAFDFEFLKSRFLGQARIDLLNDINTDVFGRLVTAATAYAAGDATAFKAAYGGVVTGANNFDVLVAMATKVNNATFGANANAAILSTYKAGAMAILKDTQGKYLDGPKYLNTMAMIENPGVGTDDVFVGDFTQYKMQMRGGMIVRVGQAGNNLIENKTTYVMEQYYFDYISSKRTPAIVKGQTFAAVKTLITT